MKHGHTTTLSESATENNILNAIDLLGRRHSFEPGPLAQHSQRTSGTILQTLNQFTSCHARLRRRAAAGASSEITSMRPSDSRPPPKKTRQFALAYSNSRKPTPNLGHDDDAEHASRKAVELSDQLPLQEKYLIQASHDQIQRDYPKAIDAYENLAKAAPNNADIAL